MMKHCPVENMMPHPMERELRSKEGSSGKGGHERKQAALPLLLIVLFLVSAVSSPRAAQAKRLFRIGTAGLTGVYYPVGKSIAHGLTESTESGETDTLGDRGVPGYIAVAQNSSGSIENVQDLASGEIEAGLVQADIAAWAFLGDHVFAGDEKVRVVRAVASLYPEMLQIVTRRDADIRGVSDLRGKRISLDEPGSGTLSVMRIVLDAHGLSEKELQPVYLKPVFTHDKILRGELQGFAMMGGAPMEAVMQLIQAGVSLVPIAPEKASQICARFPYLVPGKIRAGTYPGVPDIPTLQVHALLAVSLEAPENLVYQVTAALWSARTLTLLRAGHPLGEMITIETALNGISIPLHPGAARFYREKGMLSEGAQAP